ncbi:hypothetical protein BLA28_11500 [Eisenbergiella tayi]|uniref:Uncharacterized protein n=1 Tax=Eisenbergiella tayi TaxID=1432052 RepID=A0A1E3AGR7_9FIRM|nr:hypothetical protein [Eisenbergiella tayi]ODM07935.1 hypothetical protein BEH84_05258 [Eisenbergiella tayi]OIZ63993.1 hypothetical protein BLA28_11500 [Eisenbergiella tayi]
MKFKRVLAMAVTAVMTCSLLAGCGSSKTGAGSSESADSAGSGTEQNAAAADTGSGEKTNLKFYIWSDEENYISKVVEQYNAQSDSVHVEMISIANDSYDGRKLSNGIFLNAVSNHVILKIRMVLMEGGRIYVSDIN